jgi:hypothetical protein
MFHIRSDSSSAWQDELKQRLEAQRKNRSEL